MTNPNKPDQPPADDALQKTEPPEEQANAPAETDDVWAAAMAEQEQASPADTEAEGSEDPWAEALAEQEAHSTEADDDPWAEALAEQGAAEPGAAQEASKSVFKPLENNANNGAARNLDMILDIPVKLTVELGRTRLTIKQLLELSQGSVIELDGLAGEPMDIQINDYLIAQGEVVVMDDKYGIRITEIVTPSERLQKLNR